MRPNEASEILTVAEMSAADQAAEAAGTSVYTLMERAGSAVAEAIQARRSAEHLDIRRGPACLARHAGPLRMSRCSADRETMAATALWPPAGCGRPAGA